MGSHIQHVCMVLQKLLQHQLYVKTGKCKFHKDNITFLGYIIDTTGVFMDQKKVDAVLNWPTPPIIKELQRFLGIQELHYHVTYKRGKEKVCMEF